MKYRILNKKELTKDLFPLLFDVRMLRNAGVKSAVNGKSKTSHLLTIGMSLNMKN